MTSTGTMQGLHGDKPSSKVLNPPGGRSSNIFGVEETRPASASKQTTGISNVFGQTETSDDNSLTQGSKNKAKSQESSKFIYGGDIFTRCNVNRYEKSRSSPGGSVSIGDGPTAEADGPLLSRPATGAGEAGYIGNTQDQRLESRFDELRLEGVSRAATRGLESRTEEASGDRTNSRAMEVQTDATNIRVTSRAMQTLGDDRVATRASPLAERTTPLSVCAAPQGDRAASIGENKSLDVPASPMGERARDLIAQVAASRAQSRINQLMAEGRAASREHDLIEVAGKPVSRLDELKAEMGSRMASRTASEAGDLPSSRMAQADEFDLEKEAAASRAGRKGPEEVRPNTISPMLLPEATSSEPACMMRRAAGHAPAHRYHRNESTQDRLFGGTDDEAKKCGKGKGAASPRYRQSAYNPITGQSYDGSPSQQQSTPTAARGRQPPGGFSQGLW